MAEKKTYKKGHIIKQSLASEQEEQSRIISNVLALHPEIDPKKPSVVFMPFSNSDWQKAVAINVEDLVRIEKERGAVLDLSSGSPKVKMQDGVKEVNKGAQIVQASVKQMHDNKLSGFFAYIHTEDKDIKQGGWNQIGMNGSTITGRSIFKFTRGLQSSVKQHLDN